MKVIIHAGMHKTGTTSFQEFMTTNAGELLKQGIFYPDSIENAFFPEQHSDIAFLLMQGVADSKNIVETYFETILNVANNINNNITLFSGEEFSSMGATEISTTTFKNFIDKLLPNYAIVLVIRKAQKQLMSCITELFVNGKFIGSKDFLLDITIKQLELNAQIILNFKKVFADKFIPISFSKLVQSETDFCSALLYDMTGVLTPNNSSVIKTNTSKDNLSNLTNIMVAPLRTIIAATYAQPVEAPSTYGMLNNFVDVERVASVLSLEPQKILEFSQLCQKLFSSLSDEACAIKKNAIDKMFDNYPLEAELFWYG